MLFNVQTNIFYSIGMVAGTYALKSRIFAFKQHLQTIYLHPISKNK